MNLVEIVSIVAPMLAGLAWVYARIDKRFSGVDQKFVSVDRRFDQLLDEMKEMRKDIHSLDIRLTRIEGYLRGYDYGIFKKNGTEDK